MNTESTLIKNTHKLILASIIIIILVVGKSFLIPLALSILIGLIWGVSGMILFIPIAGIIKVILSHSDSNAHYAILFSEREKTKAIKKIIK